MYVFCYTQKDAVPAALIQHIAHQACIPVDVGNCFLCGCFLKTADEWIDHFAEQYSIPVQPDEKVAVSMQPTEQLVPKFQVGGGSTSKVCLKTRPNKTLTVEQIMKIVNCSSDNISEARASKPSAGDVYLFDTYVIGNDWRCDDYSWRQNGSRGIPNNDSYKKTYYHMNLGTHYKLKSCSKKFTKITYVPLSKPNLVLVHYNGDETHYGPKRHGNMKNIERPYKRTCPSVIYTITEEVVNEIPYKVYKQMVQKGINGHDQVVLNQRDLKRVSNVKTRVDKQRRLSHDDVYNLVERGYHLSDYVRNLTIFSDLLCMVASKDALQELEQLLQVKSAQPIALFYDTTFNICDFYVSPLTVKHILFTNEPSIPVAFLVHERKYQIHHELFFNILGTGS